MVGTSPTMTTKNCIASRNLNASWSKSHASWC